MKKFLLAFLLFYSANSFSSHEISEYGIALLPSKDCLSKLKPLYREIDSGLSQKHSKKYLAHFPIFKIALNKDDIQHIGEDLSLIAIPQNSILVKNISVSKDVVRYDIEDKVLLARLHELSSHIFGPHKARLLNSTADIYDKLQDDQKKKADKYGDHEVFSHYNPSFRVFTLKNNNDKLKEIIEKNASKFPEGFRCNVSDLAIGTIDYDGNFVDITSKFAIKNLDKPKAKKK